MTTKSGTKSVYLQIKQLSLPLLESFHNDLLNVDRNWLRRHPGVPFLHWTRSTETDLCGLFPADHEAWPPAGELRPYLFGRSPREHFLRGAVITAQVRARHAENHRLALYFDGKKLRKVKLPEAVEIARAHERQILGEWRSRQCRCGSCNDV